VLQNRERFWNIVINKQKRKLHITSYIRKTLCATLTGGLGERFYLLVYEKIKIYSEKFITNNSENNYKLSYTFIKTEPTLQKKKKNLSLKKV